jgi:prephenate dehydrogenase
MKITIIGIGLIGGSMAKDLRRSGFATEITGVDNSQEHAREAIQLGIVDRIESLDIAVKDADLVLVAVPVDTMLKLLPDILDKLGSHTTVADMGSTKRQITDAVRNHINRRHYVPAHPMAGTENSGPSAAMETNWSPAPCTGRKNVLCPGNGHCLYVI